MIEAPSWWLTIATVNTHAICFTLSSNLLLILFAFICITGLPKFIRPIWQLCWFWHLIVNEPARQSQLWVRSASDWLRESLKWLMFHSSGLRSDLGWLARDIKQVIDLIRPLDFIVRQCCVMSLLTFFADGGIVNSCGKWNGRSSRARVHIARYNCF